MSDNTLLTHLNFYILIFFSETTTPIGTKLEEMINRFIVYV